MEAFLPAAPAVVALLMDVQGHCCE
jgi:hypothetical protein